MQPRISGGKFGTSWTAAMLADLWVLSSADFLARYRSISPDSHEHMMRRCGTTVGRHDAAVQNGTIGPAPLSLQQRISRALGKPVTVPPDPQPSKQPQPVENTKQPVIQVVPSDQKPGDAGWVDPDVLWQRITKQRKHGTSVEALADEMDAPPRNVRAALKTLQEKRKDLVVDGLGEVRVQLEAPRSNREVSVTLPGDEIEIALISDTHLVSVHTDEQALNDFYDLCVQRGITTVIHAGDIVEGMGVYKGQTHEIMFSGYGRHREYLVKNYPKRPGITTLLTGGNHDESYLQSDGADILEDLCVRREDIINCGWYSSVVEIQTGGSEPLRVAVQHGEKGGSYAVSYFLQSYMNSVPWDRPRPHAYLLGHYHAFGLVKWQGMYGLLGAAWQHTPSRYLQRKANKMGGMVVGGFILKARVDGNRLSTFLPEWIDLGRRH